MSCAEIYVLEGEGGGGESGWTLRGVCSSMVTTQLQRVYLQKHKDMVIEEKANMYRDEPYAPVPPKD